jgi:2-keto-4-pentenoate hydratase/2-oxohepta-3-ene-1,7-dioic acid hydratase in catechol pathway
LGGAETAAVVLPGGVLPLGTEGAGADDLFSLLESGRFYDLVDRLGGLSGAGSRNLSGGAIPRERVSYGPPYRRPRKIWGIGLNYAEHASDLSEKPPAEGPASFMKPDTTIIGPGDEIRLPRQSERVTGEAELGIVIGREVKDVPVEDAPSVVAGLTTVLDITAEDILQENPRYLTRAKSFDTFFGFGPELVTLDEVGEIGALEVATVLNGEVRRKNVVSNMTYGPWQLVSFHSEVMTLLPGDVISTGTPGAVVLRNGDVLECRIEGFEPLKNPVRRY